MYGISLFKCLMNIAILRKFEMTFLIKKITWIKEITLIQSMTKIKNIFFVRKMWCLKKYCISRKKKKKKILHTMILHVTYTHIKLPYEHCCESGSVLSTKGFGALLRPGLISGSGFRKRSDSDWTLRLKIPL